MNDKDKVKPIIEDSTLQGFANLMKKKQEEQEPKASTDTAKGYDKGGDVKPDRNEPGVKDATVSDFILPALLGSLGKLAPEAAVAEDSYGTPLREAMKKSMSEPAKGYSNGDVVTPDEPSTQDKLLAVLKAMGMGASNAVAPLTAGTSSIASLVPQQDNGAPMPEMMQGAAEKAAVPANQAPVPNIPPPAPQASAPMTPPPPAPVAQPKPSPAPAATDILSKLTDGDGDKMQQVLAQLKDQDSKSKFANALAIIGDTLGNVGNARAGMTPQGFTSTKLVNELSDANRKKSLDMIGQQLASDPKSQTSQMAQMTLMQSMGIKPGDPRAAKIMSMPAIAITQMVPQMTEAVKNNIEKEKVALQSQQLAQSNKLKEEEIGVTEANSKREQETARTSAANDALKNVGVMNDLFSSGPSLRDAAKSTLAHNLGGSPTQAHPQDAAAVHWAHTHPNDPRSRAILSANGI